MIRNPKLSANQGRKVSRVLRLAILVLAAAALFAYQCFEDRRQARESSEQGATTAQSPPPSAHSNASPAEIDPESDLKSDIDLDHVFSGEINRRGKPVGFHSRPQGVDPEGARVVKVLDGPNGLGVYVAQVEIRDPDSGRWLSKTSTFFPDSLSRAEVLSAIQTARREGQGSEPFRGPSGLGFTIEGYFQKGKIATAYPIFRRKER